MAAAAQFARIFLSFHASSSLGEYWTFLTLVLLNMVENKHPKRQNPKKKSTLNSPLKLTGWAEEEPKELAQGLQLAQNGIFLRVSLTPLWEQPGLSVSGNAALE